MIPTVGLLVGTGFPHDKPIKDAMKIGAVGHNRAATFS
jgi:hypothetical protein